MQEKWKDGIVCEEIWRKQDRKPLIICPEPNGSGYEHSQRDMRLLLMEGERGKFSRRMARLLRLFFNDGRENPLLRCAIVDISKRSGGPVASGSRVMDAARLHASEIGRQIARIGPTHILVAGGVAKAAFHAYLLPLVNGVRVAYVPHPSRRVSNAKYDRQVKEGLTAR